MKIGDQVRIARDAEDGKYEGRTGTIVACTNDGPYDWYVALDPRFPLDRKIEQIFREDELELVE